MTYNLDDLWHIADTEWRTPEVKALLAIAIEWLVQWEQGHK